MSLFIVVCGISLSHVAWGIQPVVENAKTCREQLSIAENGTAPYSSLSELRALDSVGMPSIAISMENLQIEWQTPQAYKMINQVVGINTHDLKTLPPRVESWIKSQSLISEQGQKTSILVISLGDGRDLRMELKTQRFEKKWIIVIHEFSTAKALKALMVNFNLTPKQAEVLYWVVMGKTNADIGAILEMSPATAKKHVENIFAKIQVETRTAATNLAISAVPELAYR